MMNLTELRSYLTESTDVQGLLKALAREYHNRNLGLDSDVTTSDSEVTQSDPLVINYARILEVIQGKMLQTDLTSLSSVEDEEFYYNTIWYGEGEDGSFNIERAARMVISYLLNIHMPGIDEYIARIEDYNLPKSLGIPVDDEGLVTLDKDMELRGHALILPSRETMIYPHQFLRRFYHANFVNMPNTTVVTKWKKRDDVGSDSDEQWLGECAEKTTSRGERERRAVWIPPSRRKVAEFQAR